LEAPVITSISLPNAVGSYQTVFYFICVVYWIYELLYSLTMAYV